jgi:hypothetical protein
MSYRSWDHEEQWWRAGHATDDSITRRMRCACWITKAADTHSEHALPLQQWLHVIRILPVLFMITDGFVGSHLLLVCLVFMTCCYNFGACLYQCSLSNCIPISLYMLKYNLAHTLSRPLIYCSVANIGPTDVVAWYLVCNASSCAAVISLLVSTFRSPLDSHGSVLLHI